MLLDGSLYLGKGTKAARQARSTRPPASDPSREGGFGGLGGLQNKAGGLGDGSPSGKAGGGAFQNKVGEVRGVVPLTLVGGSPPGRRRSNLFSGAGLYPPEPLVFLFEPPPGAPDNTRGETKLGAVGVDKIFGWAISLFKSFGSSSKHAEIGP
jgi:hypothetical protein